MQSTKHNIQNHQADLILLTGATGYVGGRLLKELERQGRRVRCLVRRPEFLQSRSAEGTEIVKGDVFDREALENALKGVHAAYYLVHSLAGRGPFEENDRRAATNFAAAACAANLKKIVYLGGLGEGDDLQAVQEAKQEADQEARQVLRVETET